MTKATTQVGTKPENRLIKYFKETRAELRKVTWPTRKQATNLTLIVLAVTTAMALFLGAFDKLFETIIGLLIS